MRRWIQHNPAAVLKYIIDYKAEHDGLSPTLRDICMKLDIASTSSVSYILAGLEKQGKIRKLGDWKRGIVVTGGQWRMA